VIYGEERAEEEGPGHEAELKEESYERLSSFLCERKDASSPPDRENAGRHEAETECSRDEQAEKRCMRESRGSGAGRQVGNKMQCE